MLDDWVTISFLVASSFLAVISIGLLVRYTQVSRRISASTDLGRDLWQALDSRLRKQDERILDLMGRVEVIQTRVVTTEPGQRGVVLPKMSGKTGEDGRHPERDSNPRQVAPPSLEGSPEIGANSPTPGPSVGSTFREPDESGSKDELQFIKSTLKTQEDTMTEILSKMKSIQDSIAGAQTAHMPAPTPNPSQQNAAFEVSRVSTKVDEKVLLKLLSEAPRSSVEIRTQFRVTREHAARVLKELFERGLVLRNEAHKPFVYEITDAGRQYLLEL